jgi:uncharacterized protein YqfA (UPF0365 family)
MDKTPIIIVAIVVVGILGLIILVTFLAFFRLWLRAWLSGAGVSIFSLVGMTLRKVNPAVIVDSRIMAVKAGLEISTNDLETHYLAGGNVVRVVQALIAANKANIDLDFQRSTAIDLAGRDLLDAVQTSVNPRVIDCPDPSRGATTVAAVAMDGIQLKAKARVTVRTNIGSRDRAHEHREPRRRRHGRDDYRTRRRGHCDDHRLVRLAQESARESG